MNDSNWLFNWWKAHKNKYPHMTATVRDSLAIPASKVLCERQFSAEEIWLVYTGFSLHANTMRQLLLLQASIRQAYKQGH